MITPILSDVIVWTGDSVLQDETGLSKVNTLAKMKRVAKFLRASFPDAFIVPVLGNHDSHLPNQFLDYLVKPNSFYVDYLQEGMLELLLPDSARESFAKCGFYSVVKKGKLMQVKFVVLNTNLYYENHQPMKLEGEI